MNNNQERNWFTMKYFSEKTKKFYDDAPACEAAEKAFDEEQAKIAAEKQLLADTRKERAKEVEDAYIASKEADKKYIELRNKFIKDYGSFHMTIRNQEIPSPFEDFFRAFFN